MNFAVGAFEDESVEVFPLSWMIDGNSCYWAPFKGNQLTKVIQQMEQPNDTWPIEHNMRILGQFGKFGNHHHHQFHHQLIVYFLPRLIKGIDGCFPTANNFSTLSFIAHCFTINFRINSLSGQLALLPAHLSSLYTN